MPDVEPALHQNSAGKPRVDRCIDTSVDVANRWPEVAREGHEVVHLAELVRIDVLEAADLVASTTRQARVDRRRDAVRTVVRRAHQLVVNSEQVPPPVPDPGGAHRQSRRELVLDPALYLPIVRPLAISGQEIGIVERVDPGCAEVGVRHRPALAIGLRAPQVAVGDAAAVRVGPCARSTVGRRHDAARVVGVRRRHRLNEPPDGEL